MHGSMRRGLETEHLAMVTAVKRPAGETRAKVAAGPNAGQRHRASPRPYSEIGVGSRDWLGSAPLWASGPSVSRLLAGDRSGDQRHPPCWWPVAAGA
jgi:hypothetical protein